MSTPVEHEAETGIDLERIIFFSDAVFAISITLLVLDIHVPEGIPFNLSLEEGNRALVHALGDLFAPVLSYAISFLVVALYWVAHHRVFRLIKSYDGRLIWLNLLFLMCIAFLPFPTALLSRYGLYPVAVVVYATTLAICGLLATVLWLYAAIGHRLVDEDLNARYIGYYALRFFITAIIFLLSAVVAALFPIDPTYIELSWLSIPLIRPVLGRVYHIATERPATGNRQ